MIKSAVVTTRRNCVYFYVQKWGSVRSLYVSIRVSIRICIQISDPASFPFDRSHFVDDLSVYKPENIKKKINMNKPDCCMLPNIQRLVRLSVIYLFFDKTISPGFFFAKTYAWLRPWQVNHLCMKFSHVGFFFISVFDCLSSISKFILHQKCFLR